MPPKRIQLLRIANVTYRHKNIAAARAFYQDFGFAETARVANRTYYRGYGPDPWVLCAEEGDSDEFLGPTFIVETPGDLELAAETLPGATGIYDLGERGVPGGGRGVTFRDPVDGWGFHLVHGQVEVERATPGFPTLKYNYVSFLFLYSPHTYIWQLLLQGR